MTGYETFTRVNLIQTGKNRVYHVNRTSVPRLVEDIETLRNFYGPASVLPFIVGYDRGPDDLP